MTSLTGINLKTINMKVLKFFRKSSTILASAFLILLVSCTQYDLNSSKEQSFDYSAFEQLNNKTDSIDLTSLASRASASDRNKALFEAANVALKLNETLPQLAFDLSDYDADTINSTSLNQDWLTQPEINVTKVFLSDLETVGFNSAVTNFENSVIAMSLPGLEFTKMNIFMNVIKSMDKKTPTLFQPDFSNMTSQQKTTWYQCAAASIALTVAIAGTTSCLTVAACGLALVLVYAASNGFAHNCLGD